PDRSIAGVAEQQLSDLRAIGIDWDGPELVQSHQRPAHDAAVAQLVARGVVYACWCTRAEVLGAASAPHENLPDGAYSGNCRGLTHDQREAARTSGRTSCLRVCADAVELAFLDEVMGKVSSAVDDFVIVRKDGVPAYNLAVVVDDAAAGVGHIVRGDDLALGTPRQLLLQSWLGLPHPSYAHVPLVLDYEGRRLSKRGGSVTVAQRRSLGDDDAQVRALVIELAGLGGRDERISNDELLQRYRAAVPSDMPTVWDDTSNA
ncbi:MAG: tRNA glutamyl-Q(34) synthetase GluQRS, partial [Thermoleophilia bacterium]|nr:tRNA glutamyl-Q(34) synthetase GluQRS [Thermoleophilia bacterium]